MTQLRLPLHSALIAMILILFSHAAASVELSGEMLGTLGANAAPSSLSFCDRLLNPENAVAPPQNRGFRGPRRLGEVSSDEIGNLLDNVNKKLLLHGIRASLSERNSSFIRVSKASEVTELSALGEALLKATENFETQPEVVTGWSVAALIRAMNQASTDQTGIGREPVASESNFGWHVGAFEFDSDLLEILPSQSSLMRSWASHLNANVVAYLAFKESPAARFCAEADLSFSIWQLYKAMNQEASLRPSQTRALNPPLALRVAHLEKWFLSLVRVQQLASFFLSQIEKKFGRGSAQSQNYVNSIFPATPLSAQWRNEFTEVFHVNSKWKAAIPLAYSNALDKIENLSPADGYAYNGRYFLMAAEANYPVAMEVLTRGLVDAKIQAAAMNSESNVLHAEVAGTSPQDLKWIGELVEYVNALGISIEVDHENLSRVPYFTQWNGSLLPDEVADLPSGSRGARPVMRLPGAWFLLASPPNQDLSGGFSNVLELLREMRFLSHPLVEAPLAFPPSLTAPSSEGRVGLRFTPHTEVIIFLSGKGQRDQVFSSADLLLRGYGIARLLRNVKKVGPISQAVRREVLSYLDDLSTMRGIVEDITKVFSKRPAGEITTETGHFTLPWQGQRIKLFSRPKFFLQDLNSAEIVLGALGNELEDLLEIDPRRANWH